MSDSSDKMINNSGYVEEVKAFTYMLESPLISYGFSVGCCFFIFVHRSLMVSVCESFVAWGKKHLLLGTIFI